MVTDVRPYSVLAAGYDAVMEHVDYAGWAEYVHDLMLAHGGAPQSIVELGCGTGTFALFFEDLLETRYLATDGSSEMLEVAKAKHKRANSLVQFELADFTSLKGSNTYELALLLYDGLNYLTNEDDIRQLFSTVSDLLVPGGRFIFDQATPANSINNQIYFEDTGTCEAYAYVRRSMFDNDSGLHETVFEMDTGDRVYVERHVQRPYGFQLIKDILVSSQLEPIAAYADFMLKQADDSAERIHWVARKPQNSSAPAHFPSTTTIANRS